MQNKSNIFLSHHSSKLELVHHLSRYLEKNGLETWYAPRNIPSGRIWDEAIHEAIKECKAVVLLFCALADTSPQVKRELSLADRYNKPVFWIRVERVEPDKLSYFLTSTQWFDWLDARDDTLEQLVHDIQSLDVNDANRQTMWEAKKSEEFLERAIPPTCTWAKGIFAFSSDREAAECVAKVYFTQGQKNPDSSLILPTGRSATTVFRAMIRIANEYEQCPFGEAHLISDTETFGVWSDHETSRSKHIKDVLLMPLKRMHKEPPEDRVHLLSGIYTDSDPVKSAQRIIRLFPPVVHAVSVSPIGEILAYEVGTYNDIDEIIDDGPRIVEVGEHSKKYIEPDQPSKSIVTIGLGTALASEVY